MPGLMLVVDASCLCEVLLAGSSAEAIRRRMASDADQAAPHIVDVEVFGVVRREHLRGQLDRTQAVQVIEDIETWPGERFGHRPLLPRASELLGATRTRRRAAG